MCVGVWGGGGGVGVLLSSLPSWKLRNPDGALMSPTVPYTLSTPLLPVPAAVMSQASWGCHVHTPPSPPSAPSPLPSLSTGLQSLVSHCDLGTANEARTKHRQKVNHADARHTRRACLRPGQLCCKYKSCKFGSVGREGE